MDNEILDLAKPKTVEYYTSNLIKKLVKNKDELVELLLKDNNLKILILDSVSDKILKDVNQILVFNDMGIMYSTIPPKSFIKKYFISISSITKKGKKISFYALLNKKELGEIKDGFKYAGDKVLGYYYLVFYDLRGLSIIYVDEISRDIWKKEKVVKIK